MATTTPLATDLTVEGVADALGIDTPAPRLGWIVRSPRRGVTQSAYQIRVVSSVDKLTAGKSDIAEVVPPAEFGQPHTLRIETSGTTIKTFVDGTLVDTTVDSTHAAGTIGLRVSSPEAGVVHSLKLTADGKNVVDADLAGAASPFTAGTPTAQGLSVSGSVETLLVDPGGKPLLRREFNVKRDVKRARIYSTALGLYELSLNGSRVGDHQLAPGWTDYNRRIQSDRVRAGAEQWGWSRPPCVTPRANGWRRRSPRRATTSPPGSSAPPTCCRR